MNGAWLLPGLGRCYERCFCDFRLPTDSCHLMTKKTRGRHIRARTRYWRPALSPRTLQVCIGPPCHHAAGCKPLFLPCSPFCLSRVPFIPWSPNQDIHHQVWMGYPRSYTELLKVCKLIQKSLCFLGSLHVHFAVDLCSFSDLFHAGIHKG